MRFGYSKDLAGNVKNPDVSYQDYDGNLKYQVDNALNTILRNQGNPDINGLLYSGRGIELGALNDVDIPIHHTLGAEKVTVLDNTETGLTLTPITNGYNLTSDGTGTTLTAFRFQVPSGININETNRLTFDFVVNSGTPYSNGLYQTIDANNPYTFEGSGNYFYEFEMSVSRTSAVMYLDATVLFSIDITFSSIKQITNPNSYLTYYDFTDGLVTLGNSVDGGSSTGELSTPLTDTSPSDINVLIDNDNGTVTATVASLFGLSVLAETNNISFEVGQTYRLAFNVDSKTFPFAWSARVKGVTAPPQSTNESYYTTWVADRTSAKIEIVLDDNESGEQIGDSITFSGLSIEKILPISTKYTLNTKTVNNVITHTTPWSASDWARINNNPNLIGKLALSTTGTLPELEKILDGSNKVPNGTFDSDTLWNKNPDWSIGNGVATSTGVGAEQYMYTTLPVVYNGKRYRVQYDIVEYTSGSIRVRPGFSTESTTSRNSLGTHSELIEVTTAINNYLYIESNNFVGSIDNVSVVEIVDSYYMCSEKSGAYLVDSRAGYGADETTLIEAQTVGVNNTATTDYPISNITTLHNESIGQAGRPLIKTTGGAYDTDIYKIQVRITISSGTAVLYSFAYGDGIGGASVEVISDTLTAGTYLYERIVPMLNAGGNNYWYVDFNTSTEFTFDGTVETNFYQATTTEVANYASTVRTNADFQQKGIQTTAFVTDGAGVPTSYSPKLLQFNGDGRYVDAGFMPPSDSAWEIDMVMFFSDNGEYELSGIQTVATGNIVYLGKKNTNVPRAYIGGIALDGAAVTLEAYHYLTLTFDGAGNGKFIVDNTSEYPYASSLYTLLAGESFFVGSTSRGGAYIGNNHRNQIGIFSYVTRQRTSLERATAHAKAKAIYPTLP